MARCALDVEVGSERWVSFNSSLLMSSNHHHWWVDPRQSRYHDHKCVRERLIIYCRRLGGMSCLHTLTRGGRFSPSILRLQLIHEGEVEHMAKCGAALGLPTGLHLPVGPLRATVVLFDVQFIIRYICSKLAPVNVTSEQLSVIPIVNVSVMSRDGQSTQSCLCELEGPTGRKSVA